MGAQEGQCAGHVIRLAHAGAARGGEARGVGEFAAERTYQEEAHRKPKKERKVFFSEEKKQKTFISLEARKRRDAHQDIKVFWLFF
jgi:hypothetical protein